MGRELTLSRREKAKVNKKIQKRLEGGQLIYCLDDMERAFTEGALTFILEKYENGLSPEEIGDLINRDPDEIFIALFHLARRGLTQRKFAYRLL